jgi:hypothetical protein
MRGPIRDLAGSKRRARRRANAVFGFDRQRRFGSAESDPPMIGVDVPTVLRKGVGIAFQIAMEGRLVVACDELDDLGAVSEGLQVHVAYNATNGSVR